MKNHPVIIIIAVVIAIVVVLVAFPSTFTFFGLGSNNVETNEELDMQTPDLPQQKELDVEMLKEGEGVSAQIGDTLQVHYVGTLTTGAEFDSSRKRGTPLEFVLGTTPLIKGFEEGVVGMKVGEVRRLIIAPEYAYGINTGHQLANQTLIFEIELVDIIKK
jgi:FKBP-type peptidyl-prolyl cis-trans isomerase